MAEEANSLSSRLRANEKILCQKCNKGYYIPYHTTADKAHDFNCSNPDCNGYIHFDPMIDLE